MGKIFNLPSNLDKRLYLSVLQFIVQSKALKWVSESVVDNYFLVVYRRPSVILGAKDTAVGGAWVA